MEAKMAAQSKQQEEDKELVAELHRENQYLRSRVELLELNAGLEKVDGIEVLHKTFTARYNRGGFHYVGQVKKGTEIRHGEGKCTWEDGDVFEGEFREDLMYEGTLTRKNGTKEFGEFNRNEDGGFDPSAKRYHNFSVTVDYPTRKREIIKKSWVVETTTWR